ncbi:asparagine synthase-related protein [Lederbergia citrisecunda]|uniref:asparagine synthase C-terminal domain-containing protein n=1 Tax=Lederbergia citrisecunda TaxID=2833583 RepID=UPI003D2CF227
MLKKLINESLENSIYEKESVALLFSGGVDSLTCLFSLLEIGIKPSLYTFYLEGKPNNDLYYSEKVASIFNLKHNVIMIPYDIEQLENHVKYIVSSLPVDRKTNVQCVFPFLYLLPEIKEQYVVTGLCADDLYGSTKGVAIKGSKNKSVFDKIREKSRNNPNASAYLPIKTLVEDDHNKTLVAPYRDKNVFDYFMSKSWSELNKPKQKQVAIDVYSKYFNAHDIYRRNSSLQVESGIREYHNELINSQLNRNNRKRVDEIYKDLQKELRGQN